MAATKEVTPRTNGPALSVWEPFAGLESWARQMADRRMPWGGLLSAFDDIDFTPLADVEEADGEWTVVLKMQRLAGAADVGREHLDAAVVIKRDAPGRLDRQVRYGDRSIGSVVHIAARDQVQRV